MMRKKSYKKKKVGTQNEHQHLQDRGSLSLSHTCLYGPYVFHSHTVLMETCSARTFPLKQSLLIGSLPE